MRTFITTVKLTNTQASELTRTIANMFSSSTTFAFNRLLTLPIGTEVTWEEDRSQPECYYLIHFVTSTMSGSKRTVVIRIAESKTSVIEIVRGFLNVKNFAGFKRLVWELHTHIIGHTIKVMNGTVEKTYAKCGCCGNPQNTAYMVKLIMNDHNNKINQCNERTYEYWCVDCNEVFSPDCEPLPLSGYIEDTQ